MPGQDRQLLTSRLGFSLQVPTGWELMEEWTDVERPDVEALAAFERWYATWWEALSDDDRELVRWGDQVGRAGLVAIFEGLKPTGMAPVPAAAVAASVVTFDDPEASRAVRASFLIGERDAQRLDARRKEPLEMVTAYVRIAGRGEGEPPEVEISRYKLKRPLETLSFYEAAKPSRHLLIRGNRPKAAYTVDGMEAIRFYCQFAVAPERRLLTYYAADVTDGWQIDCWADTQRFDDVKTTLIGVAESLRREP